MKSNMGTVDRVIRIISGLILISLVFFGPQTPWGWVGLVLLATAFIGWCPLYIPFKLSTKKAE